MPVYTLTVGPEHGQLRIDVFLAQNLSQAPSRSFVKKLIETGQVLVNQKPVKTHFKVKPGEEVTVTVPETLPLWEDVQPENIPLDIFYEDAELLIIDKPAGMLVHPAPGCYSGTLVNALLHYCHVLSDVWSSKSSDAEEGPEPFRPGIVHRLDRETSGLICVAKDNRSHVRLARQFEKHRIYKEYVSVVEGTVEFDEGLIDAPLGRHPRHFDKKAVLFSDEAKEAKTVYKVLQRFEDKTTLIALYPQSGRTHQLRVHMAHLGHPILGDDKYGARNSFKRLALHARALGFRHPRTNHYIEFCTPIPGEFMKGKGQRA